MVQLRNTIKKEGRLTRKDARVVRRERGEGGGGGRSEKNRKEPTWTEPLLGRSLVT